MKLPENETTKILLDKKMYMLIRTNIWRDITHLIKKLTHRKKNILHGAQYSLKFTVFLPSEKILRGRGH